MPLRPDGQAGMMHATWWLLLELQAQHASGDEVRAEQGSQPWGPAGPGPLVCGYLL